MYDDDTEYRAILLVLARLLIRAEIESPDIPTPLGDVLDDATATLRATIRTQGDCPYHWQAGRE